MLYTAFPCPLHTGSYCTLNYGDLHHSTEYKEGELVVASEPKYPVYAVCYAKAGWLIIPTPEM